MGIEINKTDETVDKILAALKNAAPPEGLEARIAQRLSQHETAASHRSNLLTGSTLAGAWTRGALAGAAAALFAVFAILLAQRGLNQTSAPKSITAHSTAPSLTPTNTSTPSHALTDATPCGRPTVFQTRAILPPSTRKSLLAETLADSEAPSHPAPPLPLTPQERQLAKLARIADPNQLAALNPENEVKAQAEDAAEFAKFFAPPPPPPTPEAYPELSPMMHLGPSPIVIPSVNE